MMGRGPARCGARGGAAVRARALPRCRDTAARAMKDEHAAVLVLGAAFAAAAAGVAAVGHHAYRTPRASKATAATAPARQSAAPEAEAPFDTFLHDVVMPAAQSGGIPTATLTHTMLQVERQQRDEHAAARAASPPERTPGVNASAAYISKLVDDVRTANGVKQLAAYAPIVEDIEARTGVPREVLVAIWGVESAYGAFTGSHETCRALATLAFEAERTGDHSRARLFTKELVAAMRLEADGIVRSAAEDLRGSYSGALGQCQFLPSNYFRFARRYTAPAPAAPAASGVGGAPSADAQAPSPPLGQRVASPLLASAREQGHPDIWSNEADALLSIATFLVEHGWPVHSDSWREPAAALGDAAACEREPPWDLVRPSAAFRSVRRYNPSDRYAAAVLTLANRLLAQRDDSSRDEHPQGAHLGAREPQRHASARNA